MELVAESRAIIDYLRIAGGLKDESLIKALVAVESLPIKRRDILDKSVVHLQLELNKLRYRIPFLTISALKDGWRPDRDRIREKIKNVPFVSLALLSMIAVAHLTKIYGRGTEILSDLARLEQRDPILQFGRLERQILLSNERYRLSPSREEAVTSIGGAISPPARDAAPENEDVGIGLSVEAYDEETLLAREALFQYVSDLVKLDREIWSLAQRVEQFNREARDPFDQVCEWSVVGILCKSDSERYADGVRALIKVQNEQSVQNPPNGTQTPIGEKEYSVYASSEEASPSSLVSLSRFCRRLRYIEHVRSGDAAKKMEELSGVEKEELEYMMKINYLFYEKFGIDSAEVIKQNCALSMSYYSASLPFVQIMTKNVSFYTSIYSYLLLPCLYGALGSFVFFTKRILDPLHPNPPIHRMAFRVALGALAGMSVAWMWEGFFKSSEELQTVGFGLFTLAFIFGFAIDVFFALLNQMVIIANDAVERIGAPVARPKSRSLSK